MTETEPTVLIACPFCRSDQLNVRQKWRGQFRTYRIECRSCDCRGPERDTKKAAIDSWNERVGGSEYERGKGDGIVLHQLSYKREYARMQENIDTLDEECNRLSDLLSARDATIADLREEIAALQEPEA